jgi:DNA-binding LacI/PurR family transcriptional regulator
MPTIQDVAKRAETSIATVSRVMNNSSHKVSRKTRERVLKAVEELDYQPNVLARGLQTKVTQTIGVLIPDISNPYYAEIVRGIQEAADISGHSITLQHTDRSHDRIINDINLLRSKMVDGIIFSGGIIHRHETLSALKELRRRVVVIGRHEVNFPAVRVDNIEGSSLALQHLLDLGHRRIGYIGGPPESTTAADRLTGYKSALAQNGLEYQTALVEQGNLTPDSGHGAAKRLLQAAQKPTAIFAANDLMALGAISAARELGLKVPWDLSVVGFDDLPLNPYFEPPLTTVAIPMRGLGQEAMKMLVNLVNDNKINRMKWLDTGLVVRRSTAPPAP